MAIIACALLLNGALGLAELGLGGKGVRKGKRSKRRRRRIGIKEVVMEQLEDNDNEMEVNVQGYARFCIQVPASCF